MLRLKYVSAPMLLLTLATAAVDSLAQLPPVHLPPPVPVGPTPPPLQGPPPTIDIAPALNWDFERGAIAGFSGGNVSCVGTSPDQKPHGDELRRSIGGNYWDGTLDDGRLNRCFFEARGGADAGSADFTVGRLNPSLTFLVAADGAGARVEIQTGLMIPDLRPPVGGPGLPGHPAPSGGTHLVWTTQRTVTVPATQGSFVRRTIDLVAIKDQRMRLHPVAPAGQTIRLDDIRVIGTVEAERPAPMWGFADLHTHPFNHIGFGGKMFSGMPHSSIGYSGTIRGAEHSPSDPARALPACHAEHGTSPDGSGVLSVFMEGGHNAGGYPEFKGWPRFFTLSHQQMYVDWIKRAWQGGLRVMHADVGNGPILGKLYSGIHTPLGFGAARNPLDDQWNIDTQLRAAHDFANLPDVSPWLEIARNPAEARRIVGAGKLAVILGIEVDDIGNLTAALNGLSKPQARTKIRDYVAYLTAHDVRHVIPIHLLENGFGGPAVYESLFSIENIIVNGHPLPTRDAYGSGIRLGTPYDDVGTALMNGMMNMAGGRPLATGHRGVANSRGLTTNGDMFIQELMRAGMIIDVDHMSDMSVDRTLDLATSGRLRYPVVSSHTGFRELSFGSYMTLDSGRTWVPNTTLSVSNPGWQDKFFTAKNDHLAKERDRSIAHLARIAALGGMVGVGAGPGVIPRAWPSTNSSVPFLCDGSSATFAQLYLYAIEKMGSRGVAIGTDMNGWNGMANPRFGPYACGGGMDDDVRKNFAGAQVDAQNAPVTYEALPAGRHFLGVTSDRFNASSGSASYDDDDRKAWQGIVIATEGIQTSPPGPNFGANTHDTDMYNFAYGYWLGSNDATGHPRGPRPVRGLTDTKMHQRAGWDTARGIRATDDDDLKKFEAKSTRVAASFRKMMSSTNTPMKKQVTGQADFDINLDGFAQYGMLPDFIQDVRNQGVTAQDLKPLFRSAEDYVRMWEMIEMQRTIASSTPDI